MKYARRISIAVLAALAAGTGPALAHTGLPGHEHGGFAAGLVHPVGGFDHLIAMLAVGIWAALIGKGDTSKVWMLPAAFLAVMIAGAGAGFAGLQLPLVETGIAASVLALGLMIVTRMEFPAGFAVGLVGLFALYHGHAHGAEAAGGIAAYMAGFALVTASLHIGGIVLGTALLKYRRASSLAGGLIAAAGTWLMVG